MVRGGLSLQRRYSGIAFYGVGDSIYINGLLINVFTGDYQYLPCDTAL